MAERLFRRDPELPFVASQSALRCMADCERKFAHTYVWHTPTDSDYVEPSYFRFGSAFHSILELTDGDSTRVTQDLLEGLAMTKRLDWDKEIPKLVSMVRAYDLHRSHTERIMARELEVVSENWVLYIDAVVQSPMGFWAMIDYKSIGVALDPLIKAKLKTDPQVNLYVSHAAQVARMLGLSMALFAGFSYREIEKPRERQKQKETREEFIARMKPNCRTTVMLPEELDVEGTMAQLTQQLEKARYCFGCPDRTVQNRTKCVDKGTPCQVWSRCNGEMTYTEARSQIAEDCDKF